MNGFAKITAAALSVSILSGCIFSGLIQDYSDYSISAEISEFGVERHTQDEIIEYVKNHPFSTQKEDTYTEKPITSSPYSLGRLSDESLENGLNCLNVMRYIAGLDEVELYEDYITLTQAASVVNAANNTLSHYPEQPADMSDEMYALGKEGASSSNIGWGYRNIAESILYGYMEDSDSYNIDRLGHRRWCLNPEMKKTGFGHADAYTAMYSFDFSYSDNQKTVCWPSENMPVQYFDDYYAWSISFGKIINADDVNVRLTRNSDNTVWNFNSESSDGYFNVNNGGYGQEGCVIFRPESIEDGIKAGDVYTVEISGALENPISYTVNFFDLNGNTEPEITTTTEITTAITTEETTTTTEATTTTTEITTKETIPTETTTEPPVYVDPGCYMKIESEPDKTEYNIGEELDLTGLLINVWFAPGGVMPESQIDNDWRLVIDSESPLKNDNFIVDTSNFDSSKEGVYEIIISLTDEACMKWWYCVPKSIYVTVTDSKSNVKGDVNNDGYVDIKDIAILSQYIIKLVDLDSQQLENADVIKDDIVDIKDLSQIKRYLINEISSF